MCLRSPGSCPRGSWSAMRRCRSRASRTAVSSAPARSSAPAASAKLRASMFDHRAGCRPQQLRKHGSYFEQPPPGRCGAHARLTEGSPTPGHWFPRQEGRCRVACTGASATRERGITCAFGGLLQPGCIAGGSITVACQGCRYRAQQVNAHLEPRQLLSCTESRKRALLPSRWLVQSHDMQ